MKLHPIVRMILARMKANAMTPAQLARETGLGYNVVHSYLTGARAPGVERLGKMLDAAGLEVADKAR